MAYPVWIDSLTGAIIGDRGRQNRKSLFGEFPHSFPRRAWVRDEDVTRDGVGPDAIPYLSPEEADAEASPPAAVIAEAEGAAPALYAALEAIINADGLNSANRAQAIAALRNARGERP